MIRRRREKRTRRGTGRWWTWRLYPLRKSRLFVRVMLFETKRGQLAFARMHHPNCADAAAWCSELEIYHFRKGQPQRRDPCVALVVFHLKQSGSGIVAHEMFHATMFWARRRQIPLDPCGRIAAGKVSRTRISHGTLPQSHPEERLAWVQGALVNQFYRRAYKLKVFDVKVR